MGGRAQLYHRAPHPAEDLRTLAPGDAISTTFRLDDWYTHPSGDLDLRVVYDPGEVAQRFPQVDAGRVISEPVPVVFDPPVT